SVRCRSTIELLQQRLQPALARCPDPSVPAPKPQTGDPATEEAYKDRPDGRTQGLVVGVVAVDTRAHEADGSHEDQGQHEDGHGLCPASSRRPGVDHKRVDQRDLPVDLVPKRLAKALLSARLLAVADMDHAPEGEGGS